MSTSRDSDVGSAPISGRRAFLGTAAGASALLFLRSAGAENRHPPAPAAPEQARENATAAASPGYLWFGPDEAAFVEALVDVMCPADEFTPVGTDCGLALFMDRQLAGGFGQGERLYLRGPWRAGSPEDGWQWPMTPAQFFRAGLAAAEAACVREHRKKFVELAPRDADVFLNRLADGTVTNPRVPLAAWFEELVYPLFVQACYADPIYGGNRGKVFWQMIGYPGLPAVNGLNMVKFRGQPFPGAKNPKSMEDFA